MKAGIIAANNIRYSPYVHFYTEILDRINLSYEIIVPDRNGLDETDNGAVFMLPWNHKFPTVINYIKYAKHVKQRLKEKKYDVIIVLTGINAAFLGLWLSRKYNKRYIVDIRDYSHENIYPYYLLEKAALDHSLLNIISSRKFMTFLPESRYLVCHNYDDKTYVKAHFERGQDPIRIGYVGALLYAEQCIRLMKLVANDARFTMEFYGTSDQEPVLKEKAEEIQCSRIRFHGGYKPEEKAGIIQQVDILFNAYGNGTPLLDCALSNKLYDSMVYKKPILTCAGTYMTEMAGPLAFPIDLTDGNALNRLYDWYYMIDGKHADEYGDHMIESIRKENSDTKEKIAEYIMGAMKTGQKLSTGR